MFKEFQGGSSNMAEDKKNILFNDSDLLSEWYLHIGHAIQL